MHIFGGTVAQAAARVANPDFIRECVHRYSTAHGRSPGEAELRSWEKSWPALLQVLSTAGLGDLHLLLEYELPGTSQRIDALLLGRRPESGGLVALVVELKQWTYASPHEACRGMLKVGGRDVLHPARQVGGYVRYLIDWVPSELKLDVSGIAYLHAASPDLISGLREHGGSGPSAAYPVLGAHDLPLDTDPDVLAERLRCTDLRPAPPERIDEFLKARHRPSPQLLTRFANVIHGSETFRLLGEQDKARQEILHAVETAQPGRRGHIVVVTGGPGTGKTAIATRVLADLCRASDANPRLFSPSGTLTQQLNRAVGDSAKGLIATWTRGQPSGLKKDTSIVLLDEAHRARTDLGRRSARFPYPQPFTQLMERCAVFVLFLDEGQIVRPGEGTSVDELRRMASDYGYGFAEVGLDAQFRCGGSRTYLDWIDALFAPGAHAPRWCGNDYDVACAENPAQLEQWVHGHLRHEHSARVTAGYCWSWQSPPVPPLLPEVSIPWHDAAGEHVWERPWNARADGVLAGEGVPGRAFWATDGGGHQQVGCVYTAQGMEYDYGAVILGEDIIWTDRGWQAQPEKSHDSELKGLSPDEYLRYALNTYRVLATRGTRGTRLYSTHPATQAFLRTVLPGPSGDEGH